MNRYRGNPVSEAGSEDWESIFDIVTDGITIHDADFNIIHANQSAWEMLGLQLQYGIPLAKCFRYYHGAERPPTDCPSCQTLRTGKPCTAEIFEPFLNKHLEIRAMPRLSSDGRVAGLIHVVRDITERKRAEQALQLAKNSLEQRVAVRTRELREEINERKRTEEELRESEGRYRSLASTVDALVLVDRNCRLIFANENYLSSHGTYRDSVIGKEYVELHGQAAAVVFTKAVEYVFETANTYQDEWFGLRRHRYWIRTFSPVNNSEGSISAVIVAMKDITDRKLVEEALQESERQFREIIDNNPISMAIVSRAGLVEYINHRAVETFGYELDDIQDMGRWWELAYPDETKRAKALGQWMGLIEKAIAQNREIEKREYRITCKTGIVKTVIISGILIADKILIMFEDITVRKKLEDELLNYNEKLEKLVQERTAELAMRSRNLEEMNIALHVLLQKREADKKIL